MHLIDLALGKPATQSSKHPDILTALNDDARHATDPDNPEAYFHTAGEWFPWWQVDLENDGKIAEIVIHNTDFWQHRANLLTILTSRDGVTWRPIFSKTTPSLIGANDASALHIPFSEPEIGRFVRIRLDNWSYLHLRA